MKAVAIVPAYNEEGRVGATVRSLLESGAVDRVVVVDDGSKDATGAEAEAAGAAVIALRKNRGKGGALTEGIAAVDAAAYLLADADLGETAGRLAALVERVASGGAHLAIAQFDTPGGFGLAKGLARAGIRLLTGETFKSPLSGQRAIAREALDAVWPLPVGWGVEVAMTVKALWKGFTVVEVPVELTHRATGRDAAGFLHRGRQCAAVLRTLCELGLSRGRAR